jgi:hypothetical protein
MDVSIISNNGPNKYYIYYLRRIIVSINNKLIINRDILNNKIKILSIAKKYFLLNIKKKQAESFFFLENNIKIYKKRLLLELELDNKLVFEKLLSEVVSSGFCFNFFDFLLLFFLVFFLEICRFLKNTRKE